MTHYIHDAFNFSVYASYDSEAKALRALTNALEKGWKIQGRKYSKNTLERLSVVSKEEFDAADTMVETFNLLDPEKRTVWIKRSQKGTYMDPASESYHSM